MPNQSPRPLSKKAREELQRVDASPYIETKGISPSIVWKFEREKLVDKFFAPSSNSVTGHCQVIRITPDGKAALLKK